MQESELIVGLAAVDELRDAISDFERYFSRPVDTFTASSGELLALSQRLSHPAEVTGVAHWGHVGPGDGALMLLRDLDSDLESDLDGDFRMTLIFPDLNTSRITFAASAHEGGLLRIRDKDWAVAQFTISQFCFDWRSHLKHVPRALQICDGSRLRIVSVAEVANALLATPADVESWYAQGLLVPIHEEPKAYDPMEVALFRDRLTENPGLLGQRTRRDETTRGT